MAPFKEDRPPARQDRGRPSVEKLSSLTSTTDADQLVASGQYDDALDALRLLIDRPALSAAETVLLKRKMAGVLASLARWEEARALLGEARDLARRSDLAGEEALLLVEFGKVHMVRGEIDRALECARGAIERADAAGETLPRAFAENLTGYALFTRGQLDQSQQAFERALQACKASGNLRALSLVYNNLGLLYKERCQWKKALEHFQVAGNLNAIDGAESERRKGLQNLGLVHLRLGQWPEARGCFDESLTIGRKLGDPLSVIRALLGLAQLNLSAGQPDSARDQLEQSLELCTQDAYPRETALTHRSLGVLHLKAGDFERARRCFETAWKRAVEIAPEGDLAIEILFHRAELSLAVGKAKDAENLALRSQALAKKAGDAYYEAESYRLLGNVSWALGNLDVAEANFREGVTAFRSIDAPYPLAEVLLDMGKLGAERLTARQEPEKVLNVLEEALRLFTQLGVAALRGEALLALARAHVRAAAFDRASTCLAEATEAYRGLNLPTGLNRVAEVQTELEGRFVDESVSHLNEFRATNRIAEILEVRAEAEIKIGQIIDVIASAVEADGILLIRGISATEAEPIAFRGMSPPVARSIGEQLAALHGTALGARPQIVLNTESCTVPELADLAVRHQAQSLILIPIRWDDGREALLYLDRTKNGRRGPFRLSNLNLTVVLASYLTDLFSQMDRDRTITENIRLKSQLEERIALADVVTQNREMLQILRLVEKINRSDLTVLLQGETGTGKTLLAKSIHLSSPRGKGPFVTVDCAALPDNLLESELFGYVKGSFTGAMNDKKGLFEEADGGTIFLDEVGRAGLTVQRRLLHLLDKGEVRPVGSNSYKKLDVRVICATSSKDLRHDVAQGAFIKDLYYRLNDISVVVPSLRDRVEDIPLLAEYFLATFTADTQRNVPGFARATLNRLVRYNWPGNVRELEKVVRRAAILCDEGAPIGVEHLPDELVGALLEEPTMISDGSSIHDNVEEMERRMVLKALEENNWNKSRAAIALGLSRKGLKNKITRYDLDRRIITRR
ncbi:MAG: sigma 54-interacting transcriptional regulator [Candidatus Eisenbacteria bacterium]|nr:sigma 54-interacting transcriptional regulator [Candidatus Eisenbacteria bacterium]